MSQTLSPSSARCFGLARVARVWASRRAFIYRTSRAGNHPRDRHRELTLPSGPSGKTSNPIYQQTVFTLSCTGLDGSNIRETATAGVVPVFQEV